MSAESARTTNTIERLHEEFKRRIKTQTVLPLADTVRKKSWVELKSANWFLGRRGLGDAKHSR